MLLVPERRRSRRLPGRDHMRAKRAIGQDHVLALPGVTPQAVLSSQPGNPARRVLRASGNRAPPHGGEAEAFFLCFIARFRSLRTALGSRLLCRHSPTRSVSARSSAARRRAIRCERRRRRRVQSAMCEQLRLRTNRR
jgi:hypothetical protein